MALASRLVLLLSFVHYSLSAPASFSTVNTINGKVRGYRLTVNTDDHLDVFLGIPYAQPPTGSFRFAQPSPVNSWHGVHDATFYRPACPQKPRYLQNHSFGSDFNDTSEDCLYLNVFAPMFNRSASKLPVMVWIHGGAFTYGSGSEYDGRLLAMKGVVYVSVNYRVGLMGFLSTGDVHAPGNQGQLDQIEALRWVKLNIGNFGGDPNKVTIFGQSSGGASVSSHLFSPLAKGLFRGVIAHSGVALSPFAFYRPPYKARDTAVYLGKQNGCTQSSSEHLVKCLTSKPIEDLLNTRVKEPPANSAFVPVVDGYYIHDLPENLLATGQVNNASLMTGTVSDETSEGLKYIPDIQYGISAKDVAQKVHYYCSRFNNKSDEVYTALLCQYNLHSPNPITNRNNLIAFQSDHVYHAPHIKLSDEFSRIQPNTYYYSFEYTSPNQPQPKWEGVPHTTELYYVFGCPMHDTLPCPWKYCSTTWCSRHHDNQLDKKISDDMMTMWTNFAKHLNPNPVSDLSVAWHRYDITKAYLRVRTSSVIQYHYKQAEMRFWNWFLPKLLNGTATNTCLNSPVLG